MGYRSQVALALTDDAARLFKAIVEHDDGIKELVEDADTTIPKLCPRENPKTDLGGILHWDNIKWYEGYEDIDKVEEFMNSIPDEDFYFIRVGEDDEDTERRGEFYDSDMYISRQIVW